MANRIICVVSGKGGVGKSTISVNLANILSAAGASVALVDADFYNPCINFHLGLSPRKTGFEDFISKRAKLQDVVVIYPDTGLRCLSGSLNYRKKVNENAFGKAVRSLKYDYVIVDCAPGLSPIVRSSIATATELIIMVTPDIPSATAAMKLVSIVKKESSTKKMRFVLNRVANKKYELHPTEVESLCGSPLEVLIPEDSHVPESIAVKTPVILNRPGCPSSRALKKLATKVYGANLPHIKRSGKDRGAGSGFFFRLRNFFSNLF